MYDAMICSSSASIMPPVTLDTVEGSARLS